MKVIVTDKDTGKPVAGATVRFISNTDNAKVDVAADSTGKAEISGTAERIEVTSAEYKPFAKDIDTSYTQVNVKLERNIKQVAAVTVTAGDGKKKSGSVLPWLAVFAITALAWPKSKKKRR